MNSAGSAAYAGPCPPSGTHHYRFTVYALSAPTGLPDVPRPRMRSPGSVRRLRRRAPWLGSTRARRRDPAPHRARSREVTRASGRSSRLCSRARLPNLARTEVDGLAQEVGLGKTTENPLVDKGDPSTSGSGFALSARGLRSAIAPRVPEV